MAPTELGTILSKTVRKVAHKNRNHPEWQDSRTQYSVWLIVRIFLICVMEGICPWVFYERIQSRAGYRRSHGLPNRLVSLSQAKKRFRSLMFQRALLEIFRQSAKDALKAMGPEEVRIVAIDLTRLQSDPDRDAYGAWGKDSRGLFWGYKLGLITTPQGILLGMSLMKGNWGEFNANRRLIQMARETIQTSFGKLPVDYLVCDAGFDGEATYKAAHQKLKARVIAPPRRKRNPKAKTARNVAWNAKSRSPHREQDRYLWETEEGREIFRKRSGIERVNGQLKDTAIRIAEIPPRRRGVRRLWPLCLAKLIIYNLVINVNLAQGRSIRTLKLWAA
jgi:DDE family transposase